MIGQIAGPILGAAVGGILGNRAAKHYGQLPLTATQSTSRWPRSV